MKTQNYRDFLNGKSDEGNILALVLIMVIFLSLWLSSVFLFTASAKKAVDTNISQSQAKEAAVNSAIEQTLAIINNTSSLGKGTLLGNAAANCASVAFPDYVAPDGSTYSVKCAQSPTSGTNGPLASWVVTGTSGVQIINDASASSCPSIKLSVSGGILDVQGASTGINSCVFQLDQTPGQPAPAITNGTGGRSGSSSTYTTPSGGNGNITTTDPTSGAKTEQVIKQETLDGDNGEANDGTTTDSSKYSATMKGGDSFTDNSCHTGSAYTITPSSLKHGNFGFGNLTSAMIKRLNQLSDPSCAATIIFEPGVYRFNNDATTGSSGKTTGSAGSETGSEWYIQAGTVIGGTPTSNNSDCNTSEVTPGVQFQFGKGTFVRQNKAKVYLCGLVQGTTDTNHIKPIIFAPRQSETQGGTSYSKFYWSADGKVNSLGTTDLWTMDRGITSKDGKNPETDSSAAEYALFHKGNQHDGQESFDSWSSSEQLAYARYNHHSSVSQLSNSEKEHAKAAVSVKKIDDKSDVHFTSSTCLECLNIHGSVFAPSASLNLYSSHWSKWQIEQGIISLGLVIHVNGEGGHVTPTVPGNHRDGRYVELFLKNKTTNKTTTATIYINDDAGRHAATSNKLVSLNYNNS